MSTSLFRIHGLSNYPSHFVDNDHILIESGSILSCLNTTNGHQTHVLSLTEFDSISSIASNASKKIFVIGIQSGPSSRMELHRFDDEDTELLHIFEEEECSNMGYSHLSISHDGKYMMAISNIPDLQIELWSIASAKPTKLASNQIQWDDIKHVSFSPTSNELFMSATKNTIVLWRIYYKFDQYFLTSTIHTVESVDSKPMTQLKCITFGDAGTEIVYCNNLGQMMRFDENQSNHTMKRQFDTCDIDKIIFTRFYYIIVFAEQGIIQFISKKNLQNVYQYPIHSPIKHCLYTPNYKQLLVINRKNEFLNCSMHDTLLLTDVGDVKQEEWVRIDKICTFIQSTPNQGLNMASLQETDAMLLQSGQTKTLQMIRFDDDAIEINEIPTINDVSTIQSFHYKNKIDLIALGFHNGQVGLACASAKSFKLFFVQRLFETNVKQIEFDSNGTLIACISDADTKIWFIQLVQNAAPVILGYYQLHRIPISCCFIHDAYGTVKIIIAFDNGFVATYDAPTHTADDESKSLLLESFYVDCEVDFTLQRIIRDPQQTAPDRLLCLTEDHKLRAFLLDDDATVFPDDMFVFNDHMKQMTDIRVNVKYDLLLTTSKDGMIIIRSLSHPQDIVLSIYAHSAHGEGVLCTQFVQSASKLLSIGYDGSVVSWQLELETLDMDHGLDSDSDACDDAICCECPLSAQYLDDAEEVQMNDDDDDVLRFEEMRKRAIMEEEKERFEPHLREIESELSELREEYVRIVDAVRAASDLEKLEDSELIVDNAQYEVLMAENAKVIAEKAESIKYENIGKQLVTRRIRQQCWDKMAQKLQIVHGIRSAAVTVNTFPILSRDKSDFELQKKVSFLRKMNIVEQKWSSKTQDRVRVEFDVKQAVNDSAIKYIWDLNEEESLFSVSKSLGDLLFSPLELYTNYRKRIQIDLLSLRMSETKSKFNREVEKLFELKKNEIERINEMSLEIRDISNELNIDFDFVILRLHENEDCERMFSVSDDEIGVEKVCGDNAAVERVVVETTDNAVERALSLMMNNTLESKDEVERLRDTLKKPSFVDVIDSCTYSEEQKAQVAAYEAKTEALSRAKEVRRKLLVTRVKSLKNDVSDICRAFDAKLAALYEIELSVCEDISVHELMLIHLTNDIICDEEHRQGLRTMELELVRLQQDAEKADHTYNQFNHKLQQSNKELHDLQAHDKYLDKTFRREMQSNDYFDYLFKLFRGKKVIKLVQNDQNENNLMSKRASTRSIRSTTDNTIIMTNAAQYDAIEEEEEEERDKYNPYFGGEEEEEEEEEREEEKQDLLYSLCPPDLSVAIWNRFLELRQLKRASERVCLARADEIASMEAEVNALKSNQLMIAESMAEIAARRDAMIARRNEYVLDCELFFVIKQGAVEVNESPVVTDMRRTVLCRRAVIEDLNAMIVAAGAQHIERLNQMKKFRRGINSLNWSAKLLDLEHRYYTLLTTEYQLRRVTKKDQEIIKAHQARGHENKQKNEVTSAERKLQFTKITMQQKLKEIQKQQTKSELRIDQMTKSNGDLKKEITKLLADVQKKEDILAIRQGGVTQEEKNAQKHKMDAVVTRRKLVDLVGAQADEIDFLRNELDRLRRKTFPSFSINHEN